MTERRSPWTLSDGFAESELPLAPEERESRKRYRCVNLAIEQGIESDIIGDEAASQEITPAQSVVMYRGALKRDDCPPLLIGIPHSGELVPEEVWSRVENPRAFGPQCGLDAGTRTLFEPSNDEFLAVRARLSRGVVDCNREPTDFTGKAPSFMGVSWDRDLQGRPIYKEGQALTQQEKERLIGEFYSAYYRRLHGSAAALTRDYGRMLFVDGHSFPGDEDVPAYGISADQPKPLILLGTGLGKVDVLGAEEEIVEALRATLEREIPDDFKAWSPRLSDKVAVNKIWTGTRNIRYWGREEWVRKDQVPPTSRAIQIEVNQSAYFQDGRYDRKRLELLHRALYAGLRKISGMIEKR